MTNLLQHEAGNDSAEPRIVIGGGFGGLAAATALRNVRAQITLIDRHNYHLFQPLHYLFEIAGLSLADIPYPIRAVIRRQKNTHVLLETVAGIDRSKREVLLSNITVP